MLSAEVKWVGLLLEGEMAAVPVVVVDDRIEAIILQG